MSLSNFTLRNLPKVSTTRVLLQFLILTFIFSTRSSYLSLFSSRIWCGAVVLPAGGGAGGWPRAWAWVCGGEESARSSPRGSPQSDCQILPQLPHRLHRSEQVQRALQCCVSGITFLRSSFDIIFRFGTLLTGILVAQLLFILKRIKKIIILIFKPQILLNFKLQIRFISDPNPNPGTKFNYGSGF
jgi:hypothetical protein